MGRFSDVVMGYKLYAIPRSRRQRWASGHWDGALVLGPSLPLPTMVRTPVGLGGFTGSGRRRNPLSRR